ncbi:MAG: anti-sigma regulatory factor [Synergistaceae bacterium]|jgi:anti-sigma regulatory factor (Ser/Thr protein kinase)|nr:anti-sigma regulatory factor [Synergistaceae bacterium]
MADPIHLEYEIAADDYMAAGAASNSIKEALKMLGVPTAISRRAAIITYEAEMNLVIHGGGGKIVANIDESSVELMTIDQGPGIPDVEKAVQEGFTTAGDRAREMGFGAGMGLPNIKRNADVFEIFTEVGAGTTLRTVINLP